MAFSFGLLLILCGIGIMGFGLLLFYAWLPIFYGLFGFEIGLLLGKWLTSDVGVTAIVLGIVAGIVFASAAYAIAPYKRALIGFAGGVMLVLAIASLLGLDRLMSGILGTMLALCGGIIGAIVATAFFDLFIVVVSAIGGATLIVTGAQLLLPSGAAPSDSFLPTLLTAILAFFGARWQLSNIAKWIPPRSADEGQISDPIGKQAGLRKP